MMAPDRGVVHDPLGIVPHAIGIDHSTARGFGDLQHRPVDVSPARPAIMRCGGGPHPAGQFCLIEVEVAANPAAGAQQPPEQ